MTSLRLVPVAIDYSPLLGWEHRVVALDNADDDSENTQR